MSRVNQTLEVVDKGEAGDRHRTPLLFVHGAFHSAWCWDEHFLDFFADRGYRAVALNLRGHANSPSPTPLSRCTVADYVDDVHAVAQGLPTPPVVIGHSMGGFVVQKYLAAHVAPAGVLVASAPPRGLVPAVARIIRTHPRHSARTRSLDKPLEFFGTPQIARALFYSPGTPDELVDRYVGRLQDESTRVLYRDLTFGDLAQPRRVSAPMLVLGAELDGFFSMREVRATARAYRTVAEFFPAMGHNMMLEPGWAAVAEHIDTWLTGQGL
ncbi:alpha/beta hydrolase [Mycolicibacterium komossense]|uniref:Alpha/beta hydrolase n=1 Tax=Mycolicibacterium komossense TaxID=1779 RepID=A0ABT3CI09_9MYCO|nr:alpha/beta hydrolase [Mycolicibacterium komossense]MCV7229161.1 alpha/beta hydrolase [Mycolicibacterium komossense]